MNDELPWYRSTIIIGALVSALSKLLVLSGLISALSPSDEQMLTNTLVLLGGGIGDLIAVVGRVRQTSAPKIVHRGGKGGGSTLNCHALSILAAFGAVLLLLGCATPSTPKQALYAALGGYEAAAASAADYAEGPTADPAIVHRIRSVADSASVAAALSFAHAFVNCGKPSAERDPAIACAAFDFSGATLRANAIMLRAAIANLRAK